MPIEITNQAIFTFSLAVMARSNGASNCVE